MPHLETTIPGSPAVVGEAHVLSSQGSRRVPITVAPPDAKALGRMKKGVLVTEILRLRAVLEDALIQEQRAGEDFRVARDRVWELEAGLTDAERLAKSTGGSLEFARRNVEYLDGIIAKQAETLSFLRENLALAMVIAGSLSGRLKSLKVAEGSFRTHLHVVSQAAVLSILVQTLDECCERSK